VLNFESGILNLEFGLRLCRAGLLLASFVAAGDEKKILRGVYPESSEWAEDDMSF
jgi:hypothetical protein